MVALSHKLKVTDQSLQSNHFRVITDLIGGILIHQK